MTRVIKLRIELRKVSIFLCPLRNFKSFFHLDVGKHSLKGNSNAKANQNNTKTKTNKIKPTKAKPNKNC